jgi:hypothetical protein
MAPAAAGGELKGGFCVTRFEAGVIRKNFSMAQAGRQKIENIADPEVPAANAGLPAALARFRHVYAREDRSCLERLHSCGIVESSPRTRSGPDAIMASSWKWPAIPVFAVTGEAVHCCVKTGERGPVTYSQI